MSSFIIYDASTCEWMKKSINIKEKVQTSQLSPLDQLTVTLDQLVRHSFLHHKFSYFSCSKVIKICIFIIYDASTCKWMKKGINIKEKVWTSQQSLLDQLAGTPEQLVRHSSFQHKCSSYISFSKIIKICSFIIYDALTC